MRSKTTFLWIVRSFILNCLHFHSKLVISELKLETSLFLKEELKVYKIPNQSLFLWILSLNKSVCHSSSTAWKLEVYVDFWVCSFLNCFRSATMEWYRHWCILWLKIRSLVAMLIWLKSWRLDSKTLRAWAILAKDSWTDFNTIRSEGTSPNMNCSPWKKWSSMSDPFEISEAKEAGD